MRITFSRSYFILAGLPLLRGEGEGPSLSVSNPSPVNTLSLGPSFGEGGEPAEMLHRAVIAPAQAGLLIIAPRARSARAFEARGRSACYRPGAPQLKLAIQAANAGQQWLRGIPG